MLHSPEIKLGMVAGVRCNWQVSEASETLSGVYKLELVRYMYIYIYMEEKSFKI